MSYAIYAMSWLLAVFIHINTLKRTALYNTKEAIIDEIYSLIKEYKEDVETLIKETTFSHKFARIENKIKEFNSLVDTEIVSVKSEPISAIFTFDVESSQTDLTNRCYDAVEHIDTCFHEKVQSKYAIFYINRYTLAGVFCSALSMYALIEIVLWVIQ